MIPEVQGRLSRRTPGPLAQVKTMSLIDRVGLSWYLKFKAVFRGVPLGHYPK